MDTSGVTKGITSQDHHLIWGWGIIVLALGLRFFWLFLLQNQIGFDPVRYLWISEHVWRGDYLLLPQLFTTPLLPALIGLAAKLTGNTLWTGRIIGIVGNTLAVGIAILLVRRLLPRQPLLAWLTGLGLAVNHVWCRQSVQVLTDNLFYPLLLLLLLLFTRQLQAPAMLISLAFGAVWAFLFLSRDIGLYCGLIAFLILLGQQLWQNPTLKNKIAAATRLTVALPVLAIILGFWMTWFFQAFGICSFGEGHRFYANAAQTVEKPNTLPRFHDGVIGWLKLRPYECMEYTRFPRPNDARYPPPPNLAMMFNPQRIFKNILSNLGFGFKEFQRLSLLGFFTIFVVVPLGVLSRRITLDRTVILVFLTSCGILGLHLMGPAWDARLFAWFFPWIYLGLASALVWFWQWEQQQPCMAKFRTLVSGVIVIVFLFTLLFPQYFKEVPQLWRLRDKPHSYQLAADTIMKEFGTGALISSFGPEVAYRAQGYWICQPAGTMTDQIEWLYLGKADYFLICNSFPTTDDPNIFWDTQEQIQQQFPELELTAEFLHLANKTYGSKARLFRFKPQPEKFLALKAKYPWAGTHPQATYALPCLLERFN